MTRNGRAKLREVQSRNFGGERQWENEWERENLPAQLELPNLRGTWQPGCPKRCSPSLRREGEAASILVFLKNHEST